MDTVRFSRFQEIAHGAKLEVRKSVSEWRQILETHPNLSIKKEEIDALDQRFQFEFLHLIRLIKKDMELYYTSSPWQFNEAVQSWKDDPNVQFEVDDSFKVIGLGIFFDAKKVAICIPNSIDKMLRRM